jgi:hypothetical protein
LEETTMAKLTVGDQFPKATLKDIDGATVEFPAVFGDAPSIAESDETSSNYLIQFNPISGQ